MRDQLAAGDEHQRARHRSGAFHRPRHVAQQQRRRDADAGPDHHQPGRFPQPAPEADEGDRGDERRQPDHAQSEHERPERRSTEAAVRHQLGLQERRWHSSLDEHQGRGRHRARDQQHDDDDGQSPARLGQRRDREGERHDEEHQPERVAGARCGGRALGHPDSRQRHQDDGSQRRHHVDQTPIPHLVERRRRHRSRADPRTDSRAPQGRRMRAGARLGMGVRQSGQAAGEHGRAADTLGHPGQDEEHRLLRSGTHQGADAEQSQAGQVRTPPAASIADRSAGQQGGGETDAHRAQDPGSRTGARAQVGRRLGDGGDRADVGHQHERGAEDDREERSVGRASWFDIQTHPRDATG
ncbi:unannotated protein [freshwater metagenome]|uniref:Unannotated protein n=1 Tax=freshwater metagenome TaxID=449393 RepID=A0A6J6RKM3_9ZZZZ